MGCGNSDMNSQTVTAAITDSSTNIALVNNNLALTPSKPKYGMIFEESPSSNLF